MSNIDVPRDDVRLASLLSSDYGPHKRSIDQSFEGITGETHHLMQKYPAVPMMRGEYETTVAVERLEPPKGRGEPQDWPKTAQRLKHITTWTYLARSWDLWVTLLPILFLVLGVCALSLDKKPISKFGTNIKRASDFGPTIFPIIFAAIVARLMKGIALRRAERGTRLALLEQLIGSQSLAGTIERAVLLRRLDAISTIIIALWLLSPLGGQSSLRILAIKSKSVASQGTLHYFNISSTPLLSENSGAGVAFSSGDTQDWKTAISALLGASLLASESVLHSPVDLWNNVKIPLIEELSLYNHDLSENPWTVIDETAHHVWTSLSGLMVFGLPDDGLLSFALETSYLDIHCANSIRINGMENGKYSETLAAAGINLPFHNISHEYAINPFANPGEPDQVSSFFLDSMDPDISPLTDFVHSINLIYGSKVQGNQSMDLYKCSVMTPRVEANVTCQGNACAATHLRRSLFDPTSPLVPPFSSAGWQNLLTYLPFSVGTPHDGNPSPIDQYMMGSDTPISTGDFPIAPSFHNISGEIFAKRLTTILNTVWQAGTAPFSISLGTSAQFNTSLAGTDDGLQRQVSAANATMTHVEQIPLYAADHMYIGLLLLITLVLQGCAVAGLVLDWTATAPDILGYVSTMTRDNTNVKIPVGGSAFDGPERARCLADLRVQIADVEADRVEGHIAFRSIDDDRAFKNGVLTKKKLYV